MLVRKKNPGEWSEGNERVREVRGAVDEAGRRAGGDGG